MLQGTELSKCFGNKVAVDDLSFSVGRGEVLGFLGPNGAGKSTTMKMVAGFLQPDRGSVAIDGIDLESDPIKAKSRLGYLPEGIPLYADMPVHSFLAFVGRIRGLRGRKLTESIARVVSDVCLREVLTASISTLSKGYKRRVGIAQALLHDPPALVLDEPTDGLDPKQKDQVRALIESIAPKKAIMLSTHILEEVEAMCTRVVLINRGKVVVDSTPAALCAKSSRHNLVQLRVSDVSVQHAENSLASIDGVERVEYNLEEQAFDIVPNNGHSIIQQVTQVAVSSGWVIEKLTEEKGRLDDVFRQLTTSDTI